MQPTIEFPHDGDPLGVAWVFRGPDGKIYASFQEVKSRAGEPVIPAERKILAGYLRALAISIEESDSELLDT